MAASANSVMPVLLFYLFSFTYFASLTHPDLLSLPGCQEKCGNLAIPYPFGTSPECCFDDSFHIICNGSFEPPKPFLPLLNAEVVSISLDGKIELLTSSLGDSAPLVVEWAVGNVSCHVTRSNISRYACRSQHSECMNSSEGHICRCSPGYRGNPYIVDGCQDIDDCAHSNPCVHVCVNLPGSFKCYCPNGLVGDGRKDGTGCHTQAASVVVRRLTAPKDWLVKRSTSVDHHNGISILVVLVGMLVVGLLLATMFMEPESSNQQQERKLKNIAENGGDWLKEQIRPKMKTYSEAKLNQITDAYRNEFTPGCKPGTFYHGTLRDNDHNTDVVVVKVERVPLEQKKDFAKQLIFLSEPHDNLLRILGCCLEKSSPFIVYERHGDGETTLFNYTHDRERASQFSPQKRVETAEGVAKGLQHMKSCKCVRGSVCSASIFMDGSGNPKIFYAAGSNLITADASTSSDDPYRDPDNPNKMSDVYSFGVVLVKLLTMNREENELADSIERARDANARNLLDVVDDEIKNSESGLAIAKEVAKQAKECLKPQRPDMQKVLRKISKIASQARTQDSNPGRRGRSNVGGR